MQHGNPWESHPVQDPRSFFLQFSSFLGKFIMASQNSSTKFLRSRFFYLPDGFVTIDSLFPAQFPSQPQNRNHKQNRNHTKLVPWLLTVKWHIKKEKIDRKHFFEKKTLGMFVM